MPPDPVTGLWSFPRLATIAVIAGRHAVVAVCLSELAHAGGIEHEPLDVEHQLARSSGHPWVQYLSRLRENSGRREHAVLPETFLERGHVARPLVLIPWRNRSA